MSSTLVKKSRYGRLAAVNDRLGTVGELVRLLAGSGRWWLLPFVGVLGLAAIFLIIVQVIEYVAPFVYTLL